MIASVMELCTLEELLDLEKKGPAPDERARWVLNAPKPPGLWGDLRYSVRETVLPRRNKSSALKKQPRTTRVVSALQWAFPILRWCQNYSGSQFKADFIAGVTLASLCIPQSIGYATLAKLEPQYGLYTSVVSPLIYAVMGTSKEMVIGPVAVDSLLVSSMIQKLIDPRVNLSAYKKLIFTATFFAGIFEAAFGLFRLGFLVDFLSHAAIVGFMAGAAIIIGLQQLKGLLGLTEFTHKTDIISVMEAVCRGLNHHEWNIYNLVLGVSSLSFILIARLLGSRSKKILWLPTVAPLLSFVLSTLIVFLTKADEQYGIAIVRQVKGGVNPSSVHQLQFDGPYVTDVAKVGLIVAVVGLTEATAVGRSFAFMKGYHLDANKEMVSLGFMNIVGSLTSCYVATGSFSRTAVNFNAGSETLGSTVVMAITVFLSLQFFTGLLYYTPIAVIASLIVCALPRLINLREAYNIWKVDKLDFLACIGAFFGVLFARVEIGLLVAVTMSFAKIILVSIQPGIETLGRLPGTVMFGDVAQYPMAVKIPGILIIRVKSAWLCFANANFVRERIMRGVAEEEEDQEEDHAETKIKTIIKHVILDMSSLMSIDTSGIASLEELHRNLVSHGAELAIANPRWQVIHKLRLANCLSSIGERVFLTVGEAVNASFSTKTATV